MSFTSKLFSITLVLALISQTALAVKSEILTKLSDLTVSNDQIAQDLTDALNEILSNLVKPKTPLTELLSSLCVYKEKIDSVGRTPASLENVNQKLKIYLEEEAENCSQGNIAPLLHKCKELFQDYAYGFYISPEPISQENLDIQKIRSALQGELSKVAKLFNQKIQNRITKTTTITTETKSTLKVSADYKSQVSDYLNFKKNPIEVLRKASLELINIINKNTDSLSPKLDALNDRVFEYARAISLISIRRNQPWLQEIHNLISELLKINAETHAKSENPAAFKWNTILIRKLLQLLRDNGLPDEAIAGVKALLRDNKSPQPDATLLKVVQAYYKSSVGSKGIPDEDFNDEAKGLKIVDYVRLLLVKDEGQLSKGDVNKIIDNVDKLVAIPDSKLKTADFENLIFSKMDLNLDVYHDLYFPLYEAVVEFRDKKAGEITPENQVELFDKFLDEKFRNSPEDSLNHYYVPLKLILAKTLLTDKDYTMNFESLPEEIIQKTKNLVDKIEFKDENNILMNLLFQKNGKVTKKDVALKTYVPEISEQEISTRNIADFVNIKFTIQEEPVIENEPEEQISEPDLSKHLGDSGARIQIPSNPKILIDSGLEDSDKLISSDKKINLNIAEDEEESEEIDNEPIYQPMIRSEEIRKSDILDKSIRDVEDEILPPSEEKNIKKDLLSKSDMSLIDEAENLKIKKEEILQPEEEEEDIPENKIIGEDRTENLVNVVIGELTPRQIDIMRFSDDVIGVIKNKEVQIDENGDEVEYVYVNIIRSDSPCYEDAIRNLAA